MGEVTATATHRLAPPVGSLSVYPAAFIPIITFKYYYYKLKNCRRFPGSKKPSAESFILTVWRSTIAALASLGPACVTAEP